jgi:hypothetical protein
VKQYTVDWWEAADDELLRPWLDTPPLRSQITAASPEINKLLAAEADAIGEEVHEGLRKLAVAPLRVQFSVEEEDRREQVWSVRLINL